MTYLEIAKSLVDGHRAADYGDFGVMAGKVWTIYHLLSKDHIPKTGADFALLMVIMKLVRESHASKKDNIVDAMGYLELYARNRFEDSVPLSGD